MKRRVVLLVLVLIAVALSSVSGQDNRALQAYISRFGDASPEIKLQILQTADMLPAEELGPLYVQAVQFVLSNAEQIESDTAVRDIALFATEKIGEGGYTPATSSLWSLFVEYDDNTSRVLILDVLGGIGAGDAQLIVDLNRWVQDQANLYRGGVVPDRQVVRKAVQTLGELADASSFAVLLDVQLAQISDAITDEARAAMDALPGDFADQAMATTNAREIADRLPALDFFLNDASLSDDEQSQIAAGVLSEALREVFRGPTDLEAQRRVRYRAAQQLIDVPRPQATGFLIRHFDFTFADYDRGLTMKTWVLEAIAALGASGTDDAATRLTALLDLLNAYTENNRPYDTQIMLAVVTNLEDLGNIVAYDALFYVTLLDYPQRVRDAARQAIDAITR